MRATLERLQFKLYRVLEPADDGDRLGRRVDAVVMTLIVLSVIAVMLETVDAIQAEYGPWLLAFEVFSVGVFTVEYLARLWAAPVDHRFRGAVRGRLRYALTPMALIDLAAILPFFLSMWLSVDVHTALMLRLFRLMRVFKLARYMESLRLVTDVFRAKREALTIVLTIELFLLIIFSSVMYLAEHHAQPEAFSSIPAALWFGVVTMTTVGYGDVSPVTVAGKFAASTLALVGVAMFALPTGIIAAGFSQQMDRRKRTFSPTCPHCGNDPFVPPAETVAQRLARLEAAEMEANPDLFEQIARGAPAESKPPSSPNGEGVGGHEVASTPRVG